MGVFHKIFLHIHEQCHLQTFQMVLDRQSGREKIKCILMQYKQNIIFTEQAHGIKLDNTRISRDQVKNSILDR